MKVAIDRAKLSPEEQARLDELEALAKQHEPEPEPEPELPEAVRKTLADQTAEIVKRDAENAALREEIAKRDETLAREAFIKAEANTIPSLPGTTDEKGGTLYTLSKALSKEDYDKVLTLLKAGDAASAQLVKAGAESGSSQASTATTALDQITELAKVKVEKGEAKTMALAIDMITRERPDLAAKHLAESRATVTE